jgi:hypothetical protein
MNRANQQSRWPYSVDEGRMKKTPFDGKIKNAYNSPLHELERKDKETGEALDKFPKGKVIFYKGTYDELTSKEEAVAAEEWPEDEQVEILKAINVRRLAAAKQKQIQKEQDAAGLVKPEMENSVVMQLKAMLIPLRASKKYTDEEAKQRAAENLGLEEWPADLIA